MPTNATGRRLKGFVRSFIITGIDELIVNAIMQIGKMRAFSSVDVKKIENTLSFCLVPEANGVCW